MVTLASDNQTAPPRRTIRRPLTFGLPYSLNFIGNMGLSLLSFLSMLERCP